MREVTLRECGDARTLPSRILGFNSPAPYSVPWEDPAIVPLVRDLAPAYLRYPGGTVGNFWDWRAGELRVPPVEGASPYRQFLVNAQEWSRRRHPGGSPMDRFDAFARACDTQCVIVANLESASPDDQAEWFRVMREDGINTSLVEMGNEFWIGLLGDKESMRRFPDWSTTLRVTREYLDAISPSLADGTKIAVQSAASRFYQPFAPAGGLQKHMWEWDDDASAEDWFDAVTVHLYPAVAGLFGHGRAPDPVDACRALVARADTGTARLLEHLDETMPGKEVWVTEWGVEAAGQVIRGERTTFSGRWLHMVARLLLAMLRHPAITVSNYHALFFDGGAYAVFRRDRDAHEYVPMGPASLHKWFNEAANGGVRYERLAVDGAQSSSGGPQPDEWFEDVEAAAFECDGVRTALVHNASDEEVGLTGDAPSSGETMVAHPAQDLSRTLPETRPFSEPSRRGRSRSSSGDDDGRNDVSHRGTHVAGRARAHVRRP